MPDEARIRAAIAGAERYLNAWHGGPSLRERLAQERFGLVESTLSDQQVAQPVHRRGDVDMHAAMQGALLRESGAQQRFGPLQRAEVHIDGAQHRPEFRLNLRLRRQRRLHAVAPDGLGLVRRRGGRRG